MSTKITIPKTIEKAENRLAALDGIATAAGWERAAIVWAFTYEGTNRFDSSPEPVSYYTVIGFTRLGITGLKNQDSVRHCREAWKDAMAKGEVADINPGDTVTLPTRSWPPEAGAGNTGSRLSADPVKAVQQVIAKHGAAAVASQVVHAAPAAAVTAMTGTPEAIEITKKVMSNPKNAEVVISDKTVGQAVIQAQVSNMRGGRPVRPVPTPPKGPVTATMTALTWGILSDDMRRDLANLMGMIPSADDEMADMISEFLTDEILPLVQGCLDLLDMRSHEMSVGDFE